MRLLMDAHTNSFIYSIGLEVNDAKLLKSDQWLTSILHDHRLTLSVALVVMKSLSSPPVRGVSRTRQSTLSIYHSETRKFSEGVSAHASNSRPIIGQNDRQFRSRPAARARADDAVVIPRFCKSSRLVHTLSFLSSSSAQRPSARFTTNATHTPTRNTAALIGVAVQQPRNHA